MARREMVGARDWPKWSAFCSPLMVSPGASVLTQMPCGPSSRDTARVNEVTADRRIILDERWIPPSLVCSATPPLAGLIAELSGMLNQRGEALAARMTAPGQAGDGMRQWISS